MGLVVCVLISLIFVSRLHELAQRFESPNSQNRWDSPLFVIQVGDEVPYKQISDALFLRKPPPPNMSTQSVSTVLTTCICLSFSKLICYLIMNFWLTSCLQKKNWLELFWMSSNFTCLSKYNNLHSFLFFSMIFIIFQQPLSSTNFLYELDRVTLSTIKVSIACSFLSATISTYDMTAMLKDTIKCESIVPS